MGFVEVVDLDLGIEFIQQFRSPHTQQDRLCDLGGGVGIVELMGGGLCEVIILRQIRTQEKEWNGAEGFRFQEIGLHGHRVMIYLDVELNAGIFKEAV